MRLGCGVRQNFRPRLSDARGMPGRLGRRYAEASTGRSFRLYRASREAEIRYRGFLDFLPYPVSVFNLDNTVSYLNPSFEKTFGWTMNEYQGKLIPFVPQYLKDQTREGSGRLLVEKVVQGVETQRLTRDGRFLDVILDGSLFYDEKGQPAGQVITYWDVTQRLRADRSHNALFRIAKALHQFRSLDQRLDFITRKILSLLGVEGALVILVDEEKQEFFFRSAAYDDAHAEARYKETRFPMDKGVTGQVYRTKKPLIVEDYYNSPYSFLMVDQQTGSHTRNMLQVPMWNDNRVIGLLCAVNKKMRGFDQTDVELLTTIASIVGLPIVNARINEALNRSYEELKSLNKAKDRVIHHLSHELKTPISVIDASLRLLEKKGGDIDRREIDKLLARCRRNLQRLLEMQYEIEDIMKDREYAVYPMMTRILDESADILETVSQMAAPDEGCGHIGERIRHRIDELFGPRDETVRCLPLGRIVDTYLDDLASRFTHRKIEILRHFSSDREIRIPLEVLHKIIGGLIRNAVENTPDGGRIEVSVEDRNGTVEMAVKDRGVGMTPECRRLIFENYVASHDVMAYATRDPFDFNAGGKGFDLLRMKIFSERYHFHIHLESERCNFIADGKNSCPGNVEKCAHCRSTIDCINSGGTRAVVSFPSVDRTESHSHGSEQ
jgi:PAS domain S-box-containing protein